MNSPARLNRRVVRSRWLILILWCTACPIAWTSEPETASENDESLLAGHSYHGESFNEGPRQAARLIDGLAKIEFATSAKSDETQAFFEQGVAQLHGFWYLEAERSFRQAAKLEPDLAIAYWGMAMASTNNRERAAGLIDEAMKRRDNASRREKLYIEAFSRFFESENDDDAEEGDRDEDAVREAKKKRCERLLADLEKILHEFPDDIEARAQLALQMWLAERKGLKIASRYAVDALLDQVFAQQPMHPAHHYRIHLWDSKRPSNALDSAAKCGPSMPAVAHMWHMPGHIYSKLHRYADAAWQQEASARVDHAHMNRARLMPDQIHNFAHNNEWLIRNLIFLGRVDDAVNQARNLVSLPRHPRYNTLEKRGSYLYGRVRLLQSLAEYGLWDEMVGEAGDAFLPPTSSAKHQEEWLSWLAVAHFRTGNQQRGLKTLRSLQRRRIKLQTELLDLADTEADKSPIKTSPDSSTDDAVSDSNASDSDPPSRKEIKEHLDELRRAIARAAAAAAIHRKDVEAIKRHAKTAKLDRITQAQWLADAGDVKGATQLARQAVNQDKNQVRPTALLVHLLWQHGNKREAKTNFEKLRRIAADGDLATPMLARLDPVAEACDAPSDWRIRAEPAKDIGLRPPLDDLGPIRWRPYVAPSWQAQLPDGKMVRSDEMDGRPKLVIFYLGFGCLHCVEQLSAFAPRADDFDQAGIDMLGISTESVDQLQTGIKNFDQPISIPLMADPEHEVFELFRCWDDFEDQPLHGTFLIDARGRVRWQDISYEPFTDVDFMLEEAKRLLALP